MNRFFEKILTGFALGIGFTISLSPISYDFQQYFGFQSQAEISNLSRKLEMADNSTKEVPEDYENEKLDQLYQKGQKYRWGYGVNKNNKEAIKWYLQAADKGHIKSQSELAYMYRKGYGVKQDYLESSNWYKRAIQNGDTHAAGNLGWMYLNGYGVEKDYKLAYEFLLSAAKNGHGFAMGNIGYLYEKGFHVHKNDVLAREWYEKGKEAGDNYAMRKIRDGW